MSTDQAPARSPRSKLLLNVDSQRCVQPLVAKALGVSAAFVLQQIHWWLCTNPKWIDGTPWVYNTIPAWQAELPFLSEHTIQRALAKLEKKQILLSASLSANPSDRTKWYTINYDQVEELFKSPTAASSGQNGMTTRPQWRPHHHAKMASSFRSQRSPQRSTKSAEDLSVSGEKEKPPLPVFTGLSSAPPANDYEPPAPNPEPRATSPEVASPVEQAARTKQTQCGHPLHLRGSMILDGQCICHGCFAWVPVEGGGGDDAASTT